VRVLGPVGVSRGSEIVALPRSRKVRALLGFLTLSPSPVSRSRLCGLLWGRSQLCDLYRGDLLEGIEIAGNPEFAGWLTAQRQRYRAARVAALRELVARSPAGSPQAFRRLRRPAQPMT